MRQIGIDLIQGRESQRLHPQAAEAETLPRMDLGESRKRL